jgi:hypothetical protein
VASLPSRGHFEKHRETGRDRAEVIPEQRSKVTEYVSYLHKDRGSDYGVSLPDFPGCITAGKTLDEIAGELDTSVKARFSMRL